MKRINSTWAFLVMAERLGEPSALAAYVDGVLRQGEWRVGQPETLPELAMWLTPDKKTHQVSSGAFVAVALTYFKQRYPMAADHNIAGAVGVLRWAVTGVRENLGLLADWDLPLTQYCVSLMESIVPTVARAEGDARIVNPAESEWMFNLIEAVFFTTQRPEPDYAPTVRRVAGMLAMTKGSFKSPVIAECKAMLEGLL